MHYSTFQAALAELRSTGCASRSYDANVNDSDAAGNLENPAIENFVAGRGREVTVIVQKMLVLFGIDGCDRHFKRSGHIVFYQGLKLPEGSGYTFSV